MSQLPLAKIKDQYATLQDKLSSQLPTEEMIKLSKELKLVGQQNELAVKIEKLEQYLQENQELLQEIDPNDLEMLELTKADIESHTAELIKTEDGLLTLLAPRDQRDDYNIVLEIRAGAGGDESSIFTGDLLRMYTGLADKLGFRLKLISVSPNPVGGYKEVIAEVHGERVFSWFKYEGGVHRVQRVPETEKQGRIHTSTCSVAVMPLIEDTKDFTLDLKEVEIIASTSTGAGGQSVNTTYSAIKVKHLPTGIEARSQDERNQQQNKIKALQVLTSRVFDHYEQIRLEKEYAERKEQVGRANRNEKIRTYNYPQDRLTDHRYNLNYNQLPSIMTGDIYDLLQEIKKIEAQKVILDLGT